MLRTISRWRPARCSLPTTVAAGLVRTRMTTTTTMQTRMTMPRLVLRTVSTTAADPPAAQEPPIQLRAYQEECIQAVLAAVARGQTRVGISLATGAGKTVIFTQLVGRVQRPDAAPGVARTQTLILAHRRELVEQAARHCTRAYPAASVEVEMGAVAASGGADITVASVQTLAAGGGRRLAKFDARRFKLVLVDEAHHIVAPGYMRVLAHFGVDKRGGGEEDKQEDDKNESGENQGGSGRPLLVGVSATFSRFDGLALGAAIDEIVYHRDYVDMIGDGWLADVVFTTVQSTADLSRVATSRSAAAAGAGGVRGDFRLDDLSDAVNTAEVNDITVRTWLARAGPAAAAPRRATLVFCVDRRHVADLAAAFRRRGVDARAVTGDTPPRARAACLDAFQRGAFPVLLNCGVFTEGTDLPAVDCVVLARPTRSRNLLVQMIGRGLRLHAGKTNCHVIDLVATLAAGIVTTPTLFGLDPHTLVEAASVADLRALRTKDDDRAREAALQPGQEAGQDDSDSPRFNRLRVTDYASVFDLLTDTAGEQHIHAMTPHAWVVVGRDRYVLSGPTGSYLRIERIEEEGEDQEEEETDSADTQRAVFRAVELRALPRGAAKSPFAAPRELCRGPALAAVLHGADSYAAVAFPRNFIYRYQGWRSGPATQGQRAFLEKLSGNDVDAGRKPPKKGPWPRFAKPSAKARANSVLPDDLTRGAAADMITKIKHGARGRFAELAVLQRQRARHAVAAARAEEQRQREEVKVGPLA